MEEVTGVVKGNEDAAEAHLLSRVKNSPSLSSFPLTYCATAEESYVVQLGCTSQGLSPLKNK